jgi:electron transfer flavoprotein beta subunit
MKIAVLVQFVPDLVEELVVDFTGDRLDPYCARWILNEFDDHAIEQAILLKEKFGASVTVIAPDFEGVDDVLFTAAAKGADQIIKITADFESGINTYALAKLFASVVQAQKPDLILTGVQAHSSLDGSLGPILAEMLGYPFAGYISAVTPVDTMVIARKDYPGGLAAELEVTCPAVLGIQAAETPPRYIPISKVRLAMKSSRIMEEPGELDLSVRASITRMYPPESADRAEMLPGSLEEVADQIVQILKAQGVV